MGVLYPAHVIVLYLMHLGHTSWLKKKKTVRN